MEHAAQPPVALAGTSGFLQRVFGWMVLGLATTAAAAAVIGASDTLLTDVTSNPLLLILIFGGQLALVFTISAGVNRLSPGVAAALFLLYSALNGIIFAFVFELYTTESIFTTFLIAATMFGALALYGAVTKRDLTGLGPILFAALIALIVATFVNIFVGGSTLYWITTYAGVAVFAGLTAYDMQKLTRYAAAAGPDGRGAIQGALALYLDFINLFLFLLRIFGRARRESLLAVDEAVAAIVRELSAQGALANTYLLFTSDNGYLQGEHAVPSGKMLPYDPSTRVPLLVRGPGIGGRRISREPVSNIDIAPTILQIAGASAAGGAPVDGRSLLKFAQQPKLRSERLVLHETGGLRATELQPEEDGGPIPTRSVRTYQAVRNDRWLYVVYRSGERELYDLERDPFQLKSHHRDARYAATRRALQLELDRLVTCRGRECRLPGAPIPDPFDREIHTETENATGVPGGTAPLPARRR